MVFIPPGSFRMGSPTNEVGRLDDESPQTVVTLTKGFYMAKYKVTQTDYGLGCRVGHGRLTIDALPRSLR